MRNHRLPARACRWMDRAGSAATPFVSRFDQPAAQMRLQLWPSTELTCLVCLLCTLCLLCAGHSRAVPLWHTGEADQMPIFLPCHTMSGAASMVQQSVRPPHVWSRCNGAVQCACSAPVSAPKASSVSKRHPASSAVRVPQRQPSRPSSPAHGGCHGRCFGGAVQVSGSVGDQGTSPDCAPLQQNRRCQLSRLTSYCGRLLRKGTCCGHRRHILRKRHAFASLQAFALRHPSLAACSDCSLLSRDSDALVLRAAVLLDEMVEAERPDGGGPTVAAQVRRTGARVAAL